MFPWSLRLQISRAGFYGNFRRFRNFIKILKPTSAQLVGTPRGRTPPTTSPPKVPPTTCPSSFHTGIIRLLCPSWWGRYHGTNSFTLLSTTLHFIQGAICPCGVEFTYLAINSLSFSISCVIQMYALYVCKIYTTFRHRKILVSQWILIIFFLT